VSSYEAKQWVRDPEAGEEQLAEIPSWGISMLLTWHRVDCAVSAELRRSVGKGHTAERRLELARSTACTCGSAERKPVPDLQPTSRDRRDNRDPAQVGREHLISKGDNNNGIPV
jgi:hypothetical protein